MNILETLHNKNILICDGAMGTQLQAIGIIPSGPPEELNLTQPDTIVQIHQEYLEAGAQIILTHTFGANPMKLARYGREEDCERFNLAAVKNALTAKQNFSAEGLPIFIAGNIGPTGEFMEPYGTKTYQDFLNCFLRQSQSLAEGGVDFFLIETFSSLDEARAALEACKRWGLPVAVSMTFDKNFRTMMGTTVEECVKTLSDAGADIIGTNCGEGVEVVVSVIEKMRALTTLPLIAEPNAGVPHIKEGKTVFDETPQSFARKALALRDAGANIIGGCCGTTPAHIKALKEALGL